MLQTKTLVCNVDGTLIFCTSRSSPFFPYFMLVSYEAGSILRSLILLLSYPLVKIFPYKLKLRIMIFITFCGLRIKDAETVHRTVLPKFYLQHLDPHVFNDLLSSVRKRVIVTSVPRVMVEYFLNEYLSVDHVIGTELQVLGPCFTGLLHDHHVDEQKLRDQMVYNYVAPTSHIDNSTSIQLPRNKYPKPLIFQDGRLSFLPTPSATLSMFIWLPFGITLCFFRVFVGMFLPYKLVFLLLPFTGMRFRVKRSSNNPSTSSVQVLSSNYSGGVIKHHQDSTNHKNNKVGVTLYVCNHRTQLDALAVSMYLGKPMTVVTYGLNRFLEILAPLRTVRLARDRIRDKETIQRLVSRGDDIIVFPEGTTCREPYLLRFSPLFAELTDEVIPVAITTEVDMFYCNTVIGVMKGLLDPFFFLANPRPMFAGQILGKIFPRQLATGGGGRSMTSIEVANHVQREIAGVLGFESTALTRKNKYMLLANNSGVV